AYEKRNEKIKAAALADLAAEQARTQEEMDKAGITIRKAGDGWRVSTEDGSATVHATLSAAADHAQQALAASGETMDAS
ncbi:hypothetical protein, partial [Streptococcus pneumoniae]|uniref:hypothetical protein n=1 Tax=Streptococcus pneumoniae TaxID=1313 RepID=UPI0018B0D17F